jgi:hypothetical protein
MMKLVLGDKIIVKINFLYLLNYQAISLQIINIEVRLGDSDKLQLQ